MAYQPKSYRKLLASSVTAAVVASAFAGTAGAASSADQWKADKEAAFSYYVKADVLSPIADINAEVTRADAAKFFAQALKLKVGNKTSEFSDLSESSWANEYVAALVDAGIINGYEDGTFRPDRVLTRAEAAKMLAAAYGLQLNADSSAKFTDVQVWAAPYVGALVDAGLTEGVSATQYGVNQNLTLAQTAVFAKRAVDAGLKSPAAVPTVESVSVVNQTTLQVTLSDKTVENVTVDALKDGVATDVAFTINGNEYTANVTWVDPAPKVQSVTALNGKELLVKFNKSVDKNTAENIANYSFSDTNSVAVSGAKVQKDDTSVKLTLTNAYDNTKAHNVAVTVQDVKVKDTVDTVFPIFTNVVSVNDTTKAQITEVTAVTKTDSATSATVKFSEPIQSGATFKVNGQSVAASYVAGDTKATLSVPNGLAVGSTHKVEVVNLTDLSGNVNAVATSQFAVTKDIAAPVVQSVVAQGDNKLLVTFNKDMAKDSAALANLAANIKVKNDVFNDVTVTGVTPLNATTKTEFVVQLDRTAAGNLFSSTKTSHNLTVLFVNDTIEDYLGNKLAGTTTTATISKDVVAPEVTGVTYKKDSAGKVTSVVVNFSEGLKATAANAPLSFPAQLVNEDGVLVSTDNILSTIQTVNVAEGDKKAEFTLGTAQTVSGKYSVSFAKGWVKDTALAYNDSKAFNTVIDFGSSNTVSEFTINPASVNASNNVITVVFPEAVKGGSVLGSATDASRYSINGKALPVGSTITLNAANTPASGTVAQTIATIELPDQSVDTTDTAAIFTVNGVQSLTGKSNKAFTKAISVNDNVDAVLKSARIIDNNTIEVTFNENIAALSGASVGTEFKVYQGTTALTLADGELVANSVAGYPTKLTLDINKTTTTSAGSAASVSSVTASKAGSTGTVSGTYTGSTDKTYTVAVKTVDGTSGEATVVTVDGVDITESSAGSSSFALGNGLTIALSKGTGTLAGGDTFTFTATAAVAPTIATTTLDLTKDISVESLVPTTGVDVLDLKGNNQTKAIKVNVAK